MKQRLEIGEFGVTGLAEVRTLVTRWKKVVAGGNHGCCSGAYINTPNAGEEGADRGQ